jgi:hypothetical protein
LLLVGPPEPVLGFNRDAASVCVPTAGTPGRYAAP